MASRRKSSKVFQHQAGSKLRQSNLLVGLSRFDRRDDSRDTASTITLNDLNDSDPYKFDSSPNIGDVEETTNHHPVPQTPTAANSKAAVHSNTTPHHGATKSTKPGKSKRSPAALTEDERLQLQEEKDLKRAIEASRQDMERKERRRKRMSKDVQDSIEQKRTLEKLEKRLGETMEMVDNAKNLKMADTKSLKSNEVNSDPIIITSTSPPDLQVEQEPVACEVIGTTSPLTSKIPHSTNIPNVSPATGAISFSQLKSVSIKKMAIKKPSLMSRKKTESPVSSDDNCKHEDSRHRDVSVAITPLLKNDFSQMSPKNRPNVSATPVLKKNIDKEISTGNEVEIEELTPPLLPLPDQSHNQPASSKDVILLETGESSRKVRRNLSLTYNRKQRQLMKTVAAERNPLAAAAKCKASSDNAPFIEANPMYSNITKDASTGQSTAMTSTRGPIPRDNAVNPTDTASVDIDGGACVDPTPVNEITTDGTDFTCIDDGAIADMTNSVIVDGVTHISITVDPIADVTPADSTGMDCTTDVKDDVAAGRLNDKGNDASLQTADSMDVADSLNPGGITSPKAPPLLAPKNAPKEKKRLSPHNHKLENKPKIIKLDDNCVENSTTENRVLETDKSVEDKVNHRPPPLLFGVSTSVILSSFNNYFSQLAMAQRQVLQRVKWGSPVMYSPKQPMGSIVFRGKRTRRSHQSCLSDERYKHTLKIVSCSKYKSGVERNENWLNPDSEDDTSIPSNGHIQASGKRKLKNDSETDENEEAFPGYLNCSDEEPLTFATDLEALGKTTNATIQSKPVNPDVCDDLPDAEIYNTPELPQTHPDAILISTQENPVEDVMAASPLHSEDFNQDISSESELAVNSDPEFGESNKNLSSDDGSNPIAKHSGNKAVAKETNVWLNSRKCPPSAKKTHELPKGRRTKSSKAKISSKSDKTVNKKRKSAASRLICERLDGGGGIGEEGEGSDCKHSSQESDTIFTQPSKKRRRASRAFIDNSDSDMDSNCNPGVEEVIDLTEGSHRERRSTGKHPCPICGEMINQKEIEAHADICITAAERNLEQCSSCRKMFEKSLIELHEEQCDGYSSDEEAHSIRRKIRNNKSPTIRPGQKTLADYQPIHRPSQYIDSDNGDVMEINVADPNDNSNEEGSISPHVPTAIRCEDGGYMIDPSEISTSPIRSFVPIDELDPTERAGFQNQFQTKSKGRGMRVTTAGKRFLGSNWPGKSDEFDELYARQGSSRGHKVRGRGRVRRKELPKKYIWTSRKYKSS